MIVSDRAKRVITYSKLKETVWQAVCVYSKYLFIRIHRIKHNTAIKMTDKIEIKNPAETIYGITKKKKNIMGMKKN